MKKICLVLLACLMLVGCSSKPAGKKAVCTLSAPGLMDMDFTVSASKDDIDYFNLEIKMDSSLFGGVDIAAMSQEEKDAVQTMMLSQMGLDGKQEGIDIAVEFTDTMIVKLTLDLAKADATVLKNLGFDFDGADMNFDRFMEDAKSQGLECTKQ